MASIFSKNAILSGNIDHYCLTCAEQFTSAEDTLAHIVDFKHKENLQSCGYFDKYKEDLIRKVKGLYFCEPCSLILPTATKVDLHLDEPTHIAAKTKRMQWLKRVGNDIVAFEKFLITEEAWNGFVEDSCILCSAEFDDSSSHKASRDHILNLIKSEVMFDTGETAVYRMIDSKSMQCLTCNIIIGADVSSHFKTTEHNEANIIYIPDLTSNGPDKEINKKKEILTTSETNNDINQYNNKEKAKDKFNNGNVTKKDIKQKVKDSSSKSVNTSKTKSAADLDDAYCKNLDATNYITNKFGENFCVLCEVILFESQTEHMRGKRHQKLLELHKNRIANNYNDDNELHNNNDKKSLLECVDKYQKGNINIDLINETAVCKKCSKNIDFNTNAIEKHIEDHKKTPTKKPQVPLSLSSGIKSNGTERTTLYTKPLLLSNKEKQSQTKVVKVEDYATEHGLSHNHADNSFYCNLCSRRLLTNLNDLQNHVASNIHKENIDKQNSKTCVVSNKPTKVPFFRTVDTFEIGETKEEYFTIINNKFWLNTFDFCLITKKCETVVCLACNIDLVSDMEVILEHIVTSEYHRDSVEKSLFITSLEDEFIREIKLENYHCGYCNIIEEDWDDMLEHITLPKHKNKKSKAEQRLRDHRPNPFQQMHMKEIDKMMRYFMALHRD